MSTDSFLDRQYTDPSAIHREVQVEAHLPEGRTAPVQISEAQRDRINADFYYRLGAETQLEAVGEDELTEHYNTLPIHDQLVRDHRTVELQMVTVDTGPEIARQQAAARKLAAHESGAYPRPIGVGGWLAIAAAVLILSLTGYAYFSGLAS